MTVGLHLLHYTAWLDGVLSLRASSLAIPSGNTGQSLIWTMIQNDNRTSDHAALFSRSKATLNHLFAFKNIKLNFICRKIRLKSTVHGYEHTPCWLSCNDLCSVRLISPLWMENKSSFLDIFYFILCAINAQQSACTQGAWLTLCIICFKALCPVTFHLGTI